MSMLTDHIKKVIEKNSLRYDDEWFKAFEEGMWELRYNVMTLCVNKDSEKKFSVWHRDRFFAIDKYGWMPRRGMINFNSILEKVVEYQEMFQNEFHRRMVLSEKSFERDWEYFESEHYEKQTFKKSMV